MKNSWSVYAIVAVISVAVAIAIAGSPSSRRTEPTISIPSTVVTTTPPLPAPDTTLAAPPETTSTTTVPAPETSTTVAITTTTIPEIDRADVVVVAVNGASVAGLANRVRGELDELGYSQARPTDGTTIVDDTAVYYFPTFQREAELVAVDLGIDPSGLAPVADAPTFGQLEGDQVAVYLGLDQA